MKDSFICTINHFNCLSQITIIPTLRRAGVQIIRAIEKPWMAIIINTDNKNETGMHTPCVLFYTLLFYRLVGFLSGLSQGRAGSNRGGRREDGERMDAAG